MNECVFVSIIFHIVNLLILLRTCEVGRVWEHDCLLYNCTADGLKVEEVACVVGPPPRERCKLILPEDKCCVEWDCPP